MKIYLIRHGKTKSNELGTYNGIVDESISIEGQNKLNQLKEIYQDVKFDYIYSSPLKRCLETFAILFSQHQINETNNLIMEMNFGDWYGVNIIDNFNKLKEQGYTIDDLVNPPNGETFDAFFSRTKEFYEKLLNKHETKETILVMAHGLVIATLIKQFYDESKNLYELTPSNGLGYIIDTKTNTYYPIKEK
ncbi:MAG: histidine phosphatase family protein [Bacilli bacterium]